MRSFSIIIIILICSSFTIAKIWTVDNNPASVGDFITLQQAYFAASPGDTIYVYPSATTYAGITVTKRLYFFGVGYQLDYYGGQASSATSSVTTMTFNAGSEGSTLQGFDGNFYADVNVDNITIKRNNLLKTAVSGSNCIIIQNDIDGSVNFGYSVSIGANLSNVIIANNKIRNQSPGDYAIVSNVTSTVTVINNVIYGDHGAISNMSTTSLVQNNIVVGGPVSQNPVMMYNMSNGGQFPDTLGNIINIDMSFVFESGNWGTGLHLLPGSPAVGGGYGGTDMGIYGGDAPYVDGGIPELPAIFHFESEVITTQQNGLDVIIKAKSNR